MKKNHSLFIYPHCIACTTCQTIASTIFGLHASGTTAVVIKQPETMQEASKGYEALKSCPVSAIGQTS